MSCFFGGFCIAFWTGNDNFSLAFGNAKHYLAGGTLEIAMRFLVSLFVFA